MFRKILADIKRAPLWVWIGLGLTLVLIYFAWQQSQNGGSPIPNPTGGGGGGGGLPLPPNPPAPPPAPASPPANQPPIPPDLLPPPTGSGGSDGPSHAAVDAAAAQQLASNPWLQGHSSAPSSAPRRIVTDIRSNHSPTPQRPAGNDAAAFDARLAAANRARPRRGTAPIAAPAHMREYHTAPHPRLTFRFRQGQRG